MLYTLISDRHDNAVANAKEVAEREAAVAALEFMNSFTGLSIRYTVVAMGAYSIVGDPFMAIHGDGLDEEMPLTSEAFRAARGGKEWDIVALTGEERSALTDFEDFLEWCANECLSFEATR